MHWMSLNGKIPAYSMKGEWRRSLERELGEVLVRRDGKRIEFEGIDDRERGLEEGLFAEESPVLVL